MSRRGRSGFALAELMVALVIAGIIGVALTRLVISQARFVSVQDGMLRARSGARASLNMLTEELRAVGDSGFVTGSRDSIVVRVPFAVGVSCGSPSGSGATTVGLLPADSARLAGAVLSGFAWQDTLGTWRIVEPATLSTGSANTCQTAVPPINVMGTTTWPITAVAVSPKQAGTAVGAPMYLYQRITFRFAPSVEIAGRQALWRTVPGASLNEELVTPFDTSSRFQFLVGPLLSVRTTLPLQLDSVMGVRITLSAQSETTPQGRSAPLRFPVTTDFLFRNRGR